MKNIFTFFLTLCLCVPVLAQQEAQINAKLSPLTRKYLHDLETGSMQDRQYVYTRCADGNLYMGALIRVGNPGMAQQGLDRIGARVGTRAGNIWTVKVPVEKVAALTQVNGIAYIQLDEPVILPDLNYVRTATRVDSVTAGIGLPMAYTGKDVVMGIIDFGFDYNHPAFYDTLGTTYRIRKVWELNGTGTPPAGYSYGNEISAAAAMKARGTDNDQQTHGTCVAGVAAGSGIGGPTSSRYRGIAFNTDLVFVGVRRDSIARQWMQGGFSDFIDGINYIFAYAQTVGKPAVVNISWGSQSGPHDGSSLFNEACDQLSGSGKIIVMSAGNEGEEKIHLSKTFTASDTTLHTFLDFTTQTYKRTWVDIWGESGKTFCAQVTLYRNGVAGDSTGKVCIDDLLHTKNLMSVNDTDTCYVEFITAASEFNNKPRITINLFNKAKDSVGITVYGNDGSIHMWDEYYYYGYTNSYQSSFNDHGYPWAVTGNTVSTVSDMGSGKNVLLVGAYTSNASYRDINRNTWSYAGYATVGDITPFSSRGPMTDGRIKPDIAAPGLVMATACNSYNGAYTPSGSSSNYVVNAYTDPGSGRTFYYAQFLGTSASSPVAAGIVALMLEANPYMSPGQVKNILGTTAITDNFTGMLPAAGNNTWGRGKINAYGAIRLALIQTGIYSFQGEKISCALYPNPSNGKFTLDYAGNKRSRLQVEVFNMLGSLVLQQEWNIIPGTSQLPLDLSGQPKGLYIVNLSSADGTMSIKMLKE